MTTVEIRNLRRADTAASAQLHGEVLDMEFLTRCGPRFLDRYHRAWIDSPKGLALAAVDERGRVVGVLLGALDPAAHVRAMVRRHGLSLMFWLVVRAVTDHTFARELLATRLSRYVRGVVRILGSSVSTALGHTPSLSRRSAPPTASADQRGATTSSGPEHGAPTSGEITHLMVQPDMRGGGVGRELLAQASRLGKRAGIDEFVLVTPPDLAARAFYERLGWYFDGELTSRSGEPFVRYRLPLTS
jgi:ribosomal protein S18 acetylase RimI-like enzyme